MPNGKTHAIMTVITSSAMFSATNYFGYNVETSISLAVGGTIGLILHPDLDQAESRKGLWYKIWYPYGKMIKHRDTLSHTPPIGTIGRLLYIGLIPVSLLWWYYPIETWHIGSWYLAKQIWNIIIGLMVVDTGHYLADIITTKIKRIF